MKKNFVIFWFFICTSIYAQEKDYNVIDSLYITFIQKILIDMDMDGFKLAKFTRGFGYAIHFEVSLNLLGKHSCILISSDSTSTTKRKLKQFNFRPRKQICCDAFMNFINKNNELPYEIIEHFIYKIMAPNST